MKPLGTRRPYYSQYASIHEAPLKFRSSAGPFLLCLLREIGSLTALQFLAPKALAFVQSSLGAQYNESLGPAAIVSYQSRSAPVFCLQQTLVGGSG
jgi:hypothetical protein